MFWPFKLVERIIEFSHLLVNQRCIEETIRKPYMIGITFADRYHIRETFLGGLKSFTIFLCLQIRCCHKVKKIWNHWMKLIKNFNLFYHCFYLGLKVKRNLLINFMWQFSKFSFVIKPKIVFKRLSFGVELYFSFYTWNVESKNFVFILQKTKTRVNLTKI